VIKDDTKNDLSFSLLKVIKATSGAIVK